MPDKPNFATEMLFSEYLTGNTRAIMEQINNYRKIADIYERTQVALGRKVTFKASNNTTDKVKVNLHAIRSTNQV